MRCERMKRFTARPVMASDTGRVTLRVEYEPYERYGGGGGLRKARVSGKNLLDALTRMTSKMGLYITPEVIEELNMSSDRIIRDIIESNGDGCDFIASLVNETTGETYIDVEWDDDWDEDWDYE
jgi:hypothetical protein